MRNLQLVIFDMDGLLFDTERVSRMAWIKLGNDYNYNFNSDFFKSITGSSRRSVEKLFIKHYGNSVPFHEILNKKLNYMAKIIKDEGIIIKDGALELIDFLEKNKIDKIIASSSTRSTVENNLKLTGLYNRFSHLICGDDIKSSKPTPEIFLKGLEKTKANKDCTIVLEDSHNGLKASIRAGIRCIVIPDLVEISKEDEKEAFFVLKSLRDVIDVIKNDF